MSTTDDSENFISSYARIILSNFTVIAELIAKHSELIKDKTQREALDDPLFPRAILSEQQVHDVLDGPYQKFFKNKLTAYAMIARTQTALAMRQEEGFKERFEKGELPVWNVTQRMLESISSSDLSNIRNQLDELSKEHMEQWEQKVQEWRDHLLQRIQEIGFQLSAIEEKEFYDEEPISELMNRYTDLHLEPPKIKKDEVDFQAYYTFKLYLTLQSALGRQHKPHSPDEIELLIKQFKADLKQMSKEENMLYKTQAADTEKLLTPISFAKPAKNK